MICPQHYTYDLRHRFPSTPPVQGKDLICLCNQFSLSSCHRVNSSWGQCAAGEGVCQAIWERNPINSNIFIIYQCSPKLWKYQCESDGPVTISRSVVSVTVRTCCQMDYCNTPDYLMSFVNTSVLGKLYSQTPSVRSYV